MGGKKLNLAGLILLLCLPAVAAADDAIAVSFLNKTKDTVTAYIDGKKACSVKPAGRCDIQVPFTIMDDDTSHPVHVDTPGGGYDDTVHPVGCGGKPELFTVTDTEMTFTCVQ
jgi:hypothetical protein